MHLKELGRSSTTQEVGGCMTRRARIEPAMPATTKKLRCAVYTRKSTDEGLEKEFNTLDAQRDACEAYITSQRAEGWVLVRDRYDDGGFSGGTLERPALQRLLRDIQADLVDVIVVYKIDRLSRSLTHARKNGRLYRYYVAQRVLKGDAAGDASIVRRVSAAEIEAAVVDQVTNRLIRNRRRMLAVLKERRQGIVQDAVARGLQPSEPMQRTGLPWLAEVPTRWNRTHVGSHVRVVNGFPFDSTLFRVGEGLPLVRIRDIFRMQTVVSFAGDPVPEAAIDTGDVLVGMDGDFNVAVWQGGPAMLNQRVCCLRPDARFDRAYLALVMALALKWVNEQTFSTTVKHLSSTTIRRLRFPAPAVEEQEAIVAAVERATSAIAATEKRLRREIGLVEEYRERLIADSVTGALDVRTADIAAPLADGAEDDLAPDDESDGAEDDVGEDLDAALAEAEE